MAYRDLPPNERLRALYRRFLTDQDFYRRCHARSLAEVEHQARKLSLPKVK